MLRAILHFVLHPTAAPGSDAAERKEKLAGALFKGLVWVCLLKNRCFCTGPKLDAWAGAVGVGLLAPNWS